MMTTSEIVLWTIATCFGIWVESKEELLPNCTIKFGGQMAGKDETNVSQYSDCFNYTDRGELRNRLTPLQYHVTQEKGTEQAFSGCYVNTREKGVYTCVVCDSPLFSSESKFHSECGWPAFSDVVDQGKVNISRDLSYGMVREEVTCSRCNAHLGHVFQDGPPPTHKRYCINSASLNFHPANEVRGIFGIILTSLLNTYKIFLKNTRRILTTSPHIVSQCTSSCGLPISYEAHWCRLKTHEIRMDFSDQNWIHCLETVHQNYYKRIIAIVCGKT